MLSPGSLPYLWAGQGFEQSARLRHQMKDLLLHLSCRLLICCRRVVNSAAAMPSRKRERVEPFLLLLRACVSMLPRLGSLLLPFVESRHEHVVCDVLGWRETGGFSRQRNAPRTNRGKATPQDEDNQIFLRHNPLTQGLRYSFRPFREIRWQRTLITRVIFIRSWRSSAARCRHLAYPAVSPRCCSRRSTRRALVCSFLASAAHSRHLSNPRDSRACNSLSAALLALPRKRFASLTFAFHVLYPRVIARPESRPKVWLTRRWCRRS